MKGYCKVTLLGNVGGDPNVKTFDDGNQKVDFNVARTKGGYTRKDGTQAEPTTYWYRVVCNGGLAKVASAYVRKGTKLFIVGELEYRKYTKDGIERQMWEIVADEIQFVGDKTESKTYEMPEIVEMKKAVESLGKSGIVEQTGLPF